jgi:hypothetical protein
MSKSKDKKSLALAIDSSIEIRKDVSSGTYGFKEIFVGFAELDAVKNIFGKDLKRELEGLVIEVFPKDGYMGVSDEDGHVFASQHYINNGEMWSVYLDIIHELVHVRQFREGKNLFDSKFAYVDRPTEIEAYVVAVKEGRRIGMTEEEIFAYLEVPWITDEEHRRLARSTGVNPPEKRATK